MIEGSDQKVYGSEVGFKSPDMKKKHIKNRKKKNLKPKEEERKNPTKSREPKKTVYF
jgi:hypothetical protein